MTVVLSGMLLVAGLYLAVRAMFLRVAEGLVYLAGAVFLWLLAVAVAP